MSNVLDNPSRYSSFIARKGYRRDHGHTVTGFIMQQKLERESREYLREKGVLVNEADNPIQKEVVTYIRRLPLEKLKECFEVYMNEGIVAAIRWLPKFYTSPFLKENFPGL